MKKQSLVLMLSFFSCVVQAATTVTSTFVITNKTIESNAITSTDSTMRYTDETGNGLYKISDNYQDANIQDARQYGNTQLGLVRNTSTVSIALKGVKLGHTFTVLGKYANSSITARIPAGGFFYNSARNGCLSVTPTAGSDDPVNYVILSSSDVTKNCTGRTSDLSFNLINGQLNVRGVFRDFYLDIGRLQSDPEYRKAPPDTYTGTGVFRGEVIKNRVGSGYTPVYTNNITIVKNPYFESVTFPAGDNVFDTRTIGRHIQGNLNIPFVINGHFTPYNTISLQVISLNGFKLQSGTAGSSATIPYSLGMTAGSGRSYSLATNGSGSGSATISNPEAESYAIQGSFNADFAIDKNTAATGDYSDTLTAIFQLAL